VLETAGIGLGFVGRKLQQFGEEKLGEPVSADNLGGDVFAGRGKQYGAVAHIYQTVLLQDTHLTEYIRVFVSLHQLRYGVCVLLAEDPDQLQKLFASLIALHLRSDLRRMSLVTQSATALRAGNS